jgi:hypothetical protein
MTKAMAVTLKQPKLTEPQRYTLGMAVQNAYLKHNWNGVAKAEGHPKVWESQRYSHGTPITSVKAMLRAKVIAPSTSSAYMLTKVGIEIGEEECLERTGISPKQVAEEQRATKEKEERDREARIENLLAPFKGIKVKQKGKGRPVDLVKLFGERLEQRGTVELKESELEELGRAIEKLRQS